MRLHKCGWVSIQSGERLNGIQEVSGSIPLISTKSPENYWFSGLFSTSAIVENPAIITIPEF